MLGFFGKKKKGLALLRQHKTEQRSLHANNTPIAPLKTSSKKVSVPTLTGTSFTSVCTNCNSLNMHMIESDKCGWINLLCRKCGEVYEFEKIADNP